MRRYFRWNFVKILIIIAIFWLGFINYPTAVKVMAYNDFSHYIDKNIEPFMHEYKVPGAIIGLIENGELKWIKEYGYADVEKEILMEESTICRVESITKSVTAWGVMKLVQDGKISLDDSVEQYIKTWEFPETQFPEENITIRQLLSNTSGMPLGNIGEEYSLDEDKPSLRESLSKHAYLKNEPGKHFEYSNVGFNLLELLIEEITEVEFADYMRDEVLLPLGMTKSTFEADENIADKIPIGYDLDGNRVPLYVYPEKGSGGLFSNVEDIAIFLKAGMLNANSKDNQVLSNESIKMIYNPVVKIPGMYGMVASSYGLGHFIEFFEDDKKAVFHGGQGHGWMTHFHSFPEEGNAIIILTNSQRSWPLVSNILMNWGIYSGSSPIGMSIIWQGEKFIWMVILSIFLISALIILKIFQDLSLEKRIFNSCLSINRPLNLLKMLITTIIIVILLWSSNQDYLFISSIFPKAYKYLGVSLFMLGCALAFSAFFEKDKYKVQPIRNQQKIGR